MKGYGTFIIVVRRYIMKIIRSYKDAVFLSERSFIPSHLYCILVLPNNQCDVVCIFDQNIVLGRKGINNKNFSP
jgi:hypothetical protein